MKMMMMMIKSNEGGDNTMKKKTKNDIVFESFKEDLTFSISESAIDEEKRRVQVCALAPCLSRNNRFYSAAIVEGASGSLIGKKSFADHDTRDTKNLIGRIVGEELKDGKLYADIKISKARGISKETFEKLLDGTITDVSIAADGKTRRARMGEKYVQEVTELDIKSVDFVTEGGVSDAKVMKMYENAKDIPQTEEVKETMIENVDQLRGEYSEFVTELEKPLTDKISTLEKELEEANKAKKAAEDKLSESAFAKFKQDAIDALEVNDKVKAILIEKVTGKSEEDITKSIESNLAIAKSYEEAYRKEAKVEGVPEAKKKEEKKEAAPKLTSAAIRELDTSDNVKKLAIETLWNVGEDKSKEYLKSQGINIK